MLVPDLICEIDRRRSVVHHDLTYLHIFTWPFAPNQKMLFAKLSANQANSL